MSLPVVYRQAARRDIIDAARRYELERPGLADAFIAEVERIEAFVSEAPGLYQLVEGDVRRAMLRRFPYGISIWRNRPEFWFWPASDLRRDPQEIARLAARR